MRQLCLTILALCVVQPLPAFAQEAFKAGVAVKVITPAEPMWLAGYASRTKPSEGKVHDLHAKALALEDGADNRVVMVTTDLIGIPRELSVAVAKDVQSRTGLTRERLLLTASHTHCGPVLRDSLIDMYDLPADLAAKIKPYTERLHQDLIEVIVAAIADLKPARLAAGCGSAGFATNRREPTPKGIINGRYPAGPVDHDVPVLRVENPNGTLRAIVFGYACHNTTLSINQWCGDYAGFAQAELEKRHPGVTALYWIGCGGDANPLPRGTVELAQRYGRELAGAVDRVLMRPMDRVQGRLAGRYQTIALPLDEIPPRAKFEADALSKTHAVKKRAERMLSVLDRGEKIDSSYPYYPVQVWRLGDRGPTWIALGGEVVVDYAHRLKKELAGERPIWVTGYANDVMAYIPSRRVLAEGGYEGESAMIYYGMPTRWAAAVEELIVGKVHEMVRAVGRE